MRWRRYKKYQFSSYPTTPRWQEERQLLVAVPKLPEDYLTNMSTWRLHILYVHLYEVSTDESRLLHILMLPQGYSPEQINLETPNMLLWFIWSVSKQSVSSNSTVPWFSYKKIKLCPVHRTPNQKSKCKKSNSLQLNIKQILNFAAKFRPTAFIKVQMSESKTQLNG